MRTARVVQVLTILISAAAILVLWFVVEGRRTIVILLSLWIVYGAYRRVRHIARMEFPPDED